MRDALLSYGIEPNRVRIIGFGDTHLAEQGTDQVSHALNRRVTASVVGYKGKVKKSGRSLRRFLKQTNLNFYTLIALRFDKSFGSFLHSGLKPYYALESAL